MYVDVRGQLEESIVSPSMMWVLESELRLSLESKYLYPLTHIVNSFFILENGAYVCQEAEVEIRG